MKAVRHLPVAEQYPSSTSMVSFFASKRISGMSRSPLNRIEFMNNRFNSYSCGNSFIFGATPNPCVNAILFYRGNPLFLTLVEMHSNKTGCVFFAYPNVFHVLRRIALSKIGDTVIRADAVYMVYLFVRELSIYIEPRKLMCHIAPSVYCYVRVLNTSLVFSTVSAQFSSPCLLPPVHAINEQTCHWVVRHEFNKRLIRNTFHQFTEKKTPRTPKHQRGKTRLFVRGRETRLASGRFLRLDRLRINYIRPDLREELEPVPRNSVFRSAPLRHCSGCDSGHLGNSRGAAKRVDNFVCIHVVILAH